MTQEELEQMSDAAYQAWMDALDKRHEECKAKLDAIEATLLAGLYTPYSCTICSGSGKLNPDCPGCTDPQPPGPADYTPGPPHATGTAKVNYVNAGAGKPMEYPEPAPAMRVDDARAHETETLARHNDAVSSERVLELLRDRAAMAKELERLRVELSKFEMMAELDLRPRNDRAYFNLVAVIFRDGGHRREAIGDDVAAGEEAEKVVLAERRELERLRAENAALAAELKGKP